MGAFAHVSRGIGCLLVTPNRGGMGRELAQ